MFPKKRELNCEEKNMVKRFLNTKIPQFFKDYTNGYYDLMECYEIVFMYAHDLLSGQKIDPSCSPWGYGNSVIFDEDFNELLKKILKMNLNQETKDFCNLFLNLIDMYKKHFI